MGNKVWYNCEDCGRKTRSVWKLKKGKFCYWCYLKRRTVLRGYPIFGANLTERQLVAFALTSEQRDMMHKRIVELRITRAKYVRDLILADVEESKNDNEKV